MEDFLEEMDAQLNEVDDIMHEEENDEQAWVRPCPRHEVVDEETARLATAPLRMHGSMASTVRSALHNRNYLVHLATSATRNNMKNDMASIVPLACRCFRGSCEVVPCSVGEESELQSFQHTDGPFQGQPSLLDHP